MRSTAHAPVIMAPIGKIRIFVPGIRKSVPAGTTVAAMPVILGAFDARDWAMAMALEKTPSMKVASVVESVVFTTVAGIDVVVAERVTVGVRRASIVRL